KQGTHKGCPYRARSAPFNRLCPSRPSTSTSSTEPGTDTDAGRSGYALKVWRVSPLAPCAIRVAPSILRVGRTVITPSFCATVPQEFARLTPPVFATGCQRSVQPRALLGGKVALSQKVGVMPPHSSA